MSDDRTIHFFVHLQLLAPGSNGLYDDCNILWCGFDNVSNEHCKREANQVAHKLVKAAFISSNSRTWVDEPPSFILSKLENDVILLSNQYNACRMAFLPKKYQVHKQIV